MAGNKKCYEEKSNREKKKKERSPLKWGIKESSPNLQADTQRDIPEFSGGR